MPRSSELQTVAVQLWLNDQNVQELAAQHLRYKIIEELINLTPQLRPDASSSNPDASSSNNDSQNLSLDGAQAFSIAIQLGAFSIICKLLAVGAWATNNPLQNNSVTPDNWSAFKNGNRLHYQSDAPYSDYWYRIGYSFSKFLIEKLYNIAKLCGKYVADPREANQLSNKMEIKKAHAELWGWANQIYHQENLQAMRKSPERGFVDSEMADQSKLTPQDIRKAIIGFYQHYLINKIQTTTTTTTTTTINAQRKEAAQAIVQEFVDDYFLPPGNEDINQLPPLTARHTLRQVSLNAIAAVTAPLPEQRTFMGRPMPNVATKLINLVLHFRTTGFISVPTTGDIARKVNAMPAHIKTDLKEIRTEVNQVNEMRL